MYNPGENKGFVLKGASSGPRLIFLWTSNAKTRAEFTTWHSARSPMLKW